MGSLNISENTNVQQVSGEWKTMEEMMRLKFARAQEVDKLGLLDVYIFIRYTSAKHACWLVGRLHKISLWTLSTT